MRRDCAGRARAVYLGRDAARVLPEHADGHRPALGSLSSGTEQRKGAALAAKRWRRARIARSWRSQIAPFLRGRISAKQRFIASFSDARGRAAVCRFGACEGAGVSGHELPGPLYPHQDPAAVCALGCRARTWRSCRSRSIARWRSIASSTARTIAHLPRRIRRRCAMPARRWC